MHELSAGYTCHCEIGERRPDTSDLGLEEALKLLIPWASWMEQFLPSGGVEDLTHKPRLGLREIASILVAYARELEAGPHLVQARGESDAQV